MTRRKVGKIEKATRAELVRLGRLDSDVGATALKLAERLDVATAEEPGSALAAVAKELRATMAEARQTGTPKADPADDLARKRAERQARARAANA